MNKKYSNKYLLETGTGLQDVDGLKCSEYFKEVSKEYLDDRISLDKLEKTINTYYENKKDTDERSDEADKVSVRIARELDDDSFSLSVTQILSIHKRLFDGILKNPGSYRTYNFTKKEWVLNDDTVIYSDYRDLELTLDYDLKEEKKFNYRGLSIDEIIKHLAFFVSNLWQIHAFEEGNTRTTAVFLIKYLRTLGFDVTNDTFAKNAWYFRNALVRANYSNLVKGITADDRYLILFLRNLLLNENSILSNRDLHVDNHRIYNRDEELLKLINEDPGMKAEELADKLNISLRMAKYCLASLKDRGLIERKGSRKSGYWTVINTEEPK